MTSHKETGKKNIREKCRSKVSFVFFFGGEFKKNWWFITSYKKNKTFQGVLQERRTISDTVCIAASKKIDLLVSDSQWAQRMTGNANDK